MKFNLGTDEPFWDGSWIGHYAAIETEGKTSAAAETQQHNNTSEQHK